MKDIKEKVSYLHGLADGLDLSRETKEGRVLLEVIDVLDHFADYVTDLEAAQLELEEYVENINEDLNDLEDDVYGDEDECDCEDIEHFIDVECPKCHEIVCFEEDILDDEDSIEVTCPNCDEVIFVNDRDELEFDGEGHGHPVARKDDDLK